ncbi:MAG: hypothetical protein A2901_02695 [Elusimicrobia bacterium RIFCSPLOWO2_01_FULL_54_10]|nr:MAG: hypothetical protein A2901_02695 [Elusimicrobia bacterium RIFCSPLOWO2_01_FULL_54_10]
MLSLKQSSPRPCWLVGHRGAMGHAPENTFASFELARKMGAEFVECDVHLSKDKEVIVIHDERAERTTSGAGLIKDLRLSQIKKLDAGSWYSKKFKGEKVPALKELLTWAFKHQLGVVIEIKNKPVRYPGLEKRLSEVIERASMTSRVIAISFDHSAVKRLKSINSGIATGILYDKKMKDPVARAISMKANALFPRRNLVTRSVVEKAHMNGLAVATWTVNEPAEMKKLIACKVDGIATNYPDRLSKIL